MSDRAKAAVTFGWLTFMALTTGQWLIFEAGRGEPPWLRFLAAFTMGVSLFGMGQMIGDVVARQIRPPSE